MNGRCEPEKACTVVTGAEGGIGSAVVAELRAHGENVLAVGHTGGDVALDLLVPDACRQLAAALSEREFAGVKGFVHAAGFDLPAPLGMIAPEALARLVAVHASFPLQFLGWWRRRGHRVPGAAGVLVSSVAAHEGAQAHAAYAAAKGAVEGLLKPAAAELVTAGIRLNAVVLGVVDTAMTRGWLGKLAPESREALVRRYPLGLGDPAAVAKVIAFLLSEDAAWITGQTLVCDGGRSLS